MQNNIYIVDVSVVTEDWYQRAYSLCDESRQSRADKIKPVADKIKCVASGRLLWYAWNDYECAKTAADKEANCDGLPYVKQSHIKMPQLLHNDYGKPYFAEEDFHFSISHSCSYVCLAVADSPVGCDIQKHSELKMNIAGRFFHEKENELLGQIKESCEYQKVLFDMWSLKESYVKYTGRGLGQGLSSFSVANAIEYGKCELPGTDANVVTAKNYNVISGYSLAVSCSINDFKVVPVHADELIREE